jgi:hypothetical protein
VKNYQETAQEIIPENLVLPAHSFMIDDENTVQVKGKKIVITNITVITDAND